MAHVHGHRSAILRATTRRPPMWTLEEQKPLGTESMDFVGRLENIEPLQAFCFRYMLEECEAYSLAMVVVYDKARASKK